MLFSMCNDLKRDFYSACPVWYWPVLWWQFMLMERYLSDLYAATGRGDMEYGLALGPRGTLRLVFLSDAARQLAEGKGHSVYDMFKNRDWLPTSPTTDHPCRDYSEAQSHPPLRPALIHLQLYLDPG